MVSYLYGLCVQCGLGCVAGDGCCSGINWLNNSYAEGEESYNPQT
jgi:hypothetical protein